MNLSRTRIAALLALIIGGMAIFAGGQVVLLGKEMDYYVIDWLPVYNLTVGVLTFFVTAPLLWKAHKAGYQAAVATLVAHTSVMLILLTAYREVVASDSLRAMTVRIVVWLVINAVLYWKRR